MFRNPAITAIVIIGLIALLVLAIVLFYIRWRNDDRIEEQLRAYEEGDRPCGEVNPRTGWICERWVHHPNNHYQTINGERYDWPQ